MNFWGPTVTSSGGKKLGPAALARASWQGGRFRLQSGRLRSLYLAKGLFEIGQGASVVAFRITIRSRVLGARTPLAGSGSEPRVVPAPNFVWRIFLRFSALYVLK